MKLNQTAFIFHPKPMTFVYAVIPGFSRICGSQYQHQLREKSNPRILVPCNCSTSILCISNRLYFALHRFGAKLDKYIRSSIHFLDIKYRNTIFTVGDRPFTYPFKLLWGNTTYWKKLAWCRWKADAILRSVSFIRLNSPWIEKCVIQFREKWLFFQE